MNLLFSLRRTKFSAILLLLSLSIFLASCKPEPDPETLLPQGIEELSTDSPLIGKWKDSDSSIYEISQNEFSNYSDTYLSYAGNNLVISKTSENSGYIYIQYTRAADENWNYTTDKTKAPDIGKWYAISYKGLTASSIQISGAYKYDGKTSTETLEEAMAEFTIENGYFAMYSDCVKISD